MTKHNLAKCHTSQQFIAYAGQHGGQVVRQTGSHSIVRGPHGGICPIPCHPGDLATGTRHAIVKLLLAILAVVSLAACVLPLLQATP